MFDELKEEKYFKEVTDFKSVIMQTRRYNSITSP